MNNIDKVALRGYAGYMLSVRLKKIQKMNTILAYITSVSVLFCNRMVSIPSNIKDTEVGKTLYNDLDEYNKKIAKRNVLFVDSSKLNFSQIYNDKIFEGQTTFISQMPSSMLGENTDSCCKERNEVTLVNEDLVKVLKNTNKDLCENILIISGSRRLSRDFNSATQIAVIHNVLRDVGFDLEKAVKKRSNETGDFDVCCVSIPMSNSLNLKHIIIANSSVNDKENDLKCNYDKVNKECKSLLSDKSTKCRPIFLCPLGDVGGFVNTYSSSALGHAIQELGATGKQPIVIVAHWHDDDKGKGKGTLSDNSNISHAALYVEIKKELNKQYKEI